MYNNNLLKLFLIFGLVMSLTFALPCFNAGDCGFNEMCMGGVCVPMFPGPPGGGMPPIPECIDSTDCDPGELCIDGNCVLIGPAPVDPIIDLGDIEIGPMDPDFDFPFAPTSYEVKGTSNQLVNDGEIWDSGWDDQDKQLNLTNGDGDKLGHMKILHREISQELCFVYTMFGDNTTVSSLKVAFDLDRNGSYGEGDDFGLVFRSAGQEESLNPAIDGHIGSLDDGSGGPPFSFKWGTNFLSAIDSSEYDFDREDTVFWIIPGVVGEFCIPYSDLGMTYGQSENLKAIFAVNADPYIVNAGTPDEETVWEGGWYSWPENGDHPDTEEWGYLYSNENWAIENWCSDNDDCADNEWCAQHANPSMNQCEEVQDQGCGEVSNHTWNPYECCLDSDCADGESCNGNVCIEGAAPAPECVVDGDCAAGEECDAGSCVAVPEEAESSPEVPDVDGDGNPVCGGLLNVQLAQTSEGKLRALVNGINNCEGKLVSVREENCVGAIACTFVSGDNGGNCDFDTPTESGIYIYSVCADLDDDGTSEFKKFTFSVEVPEVCESTGCEVEEWSSCSCEEGSTEGKQTGSCVDNCGEELQKEQSCSCEVEVGPSQAELDAQEAIEEAIDAIKDAEGVEGKDLSDAESKLEEAEEAFDSGEFESAEELAVEAKELAEAPPLVEEERSWWMDTQTWLMFGMILLALLVVYLLWDRMHRKPIEKKMKEQKKSSKKEEPSEEEF